MAKNYRITYVKNTVKFSEKITVDEMTYSDPADRALKVAMERGHVSNDYRSKNAVLKVEEI